VGCFVDTNCTNFSRIRGEVRAAGAAGRGGLEFEKGSYGVCLDEGRGHSRAQGGLAAFVAEVSKRTGFFNAPGFNRQLVEFEQVFKFRGHARNKR